ncbi:phosphate signaling complex protein PhoU [Geomonas terrae]|jgi:phosphate transport system protein|uniref:Phosphate-specific transport system accessory protein PhoU n=1 Tax=Geomonas terrae TaxID=2562681 RepID=A0A4S1CC39_9BACT|nr:MULTISPECIES: phosphate signaling complex protein PhoU [Geomonas]TGU70506.1 phosphate signaling complex protein PhoU [Geomonas terrae]TGU72926.1 phosphate signaling complex protein PhoU [Geomonas terrae]TSK06045.1 MAG: phosphate signaling complex protein PhoU [Geobacter sp.]
MEREHFSRQFDNELNQIREKLLEMGGKVEVMIANAMKSLVERDTELAERTIAFDHEINTLEMVIDEKCLEVLARRQPAARDLRFITLALKIVTDLERIGDQCANICKRARELNQEPALKPYIDLPRMAQAASDMVKEALDAFVRGDDALAIKVCQDDQCVDELNEQIQRELLTFMMGDPKCISRAMKIIQVSKGLERIADHATNIAEMVIFMIKGKDIRHTIA